MWPAVHQKEEDHTGAFGDGARNKENLAFKRAKEERDTVHEERLLQGFLEEERKVVHPAHVTVPAPVHVPTTMSAGAQPVNRPVSSPCLLAGRGNSSGHYPLQPALGLESEEEGEGQQMTLNIRHPSLHRLEQGPPGTQRTRRRNGWMWSQRRLLSRISKSSSRAEKSTMTPALEPELESHVLRAALHAVFTLGTEKDTTQVQDLHRVLPDILDAMLGNLLAESPDTDKLHYILENSRIPQDGSPCGTAGSVHE
ncbi:uncharacterized protein LOC122459445 [Dermochelys coriacea]|uniref:uncharacterized protein LOC122459445 n=1 Tax=Dermochelys coriacea TaxID=27794 RepID=UPI001CAA0CB6|nr:uncharacterized protein LOC122459445 [Dermochelys coriacea]